MKKAVTSLIIILTIFTNLHADKYKYRQFPHVKKFYSEITLDAIEIGKKYNIPPAALLAIAGLESGYGRGYVGQITGNILSLGAFKGDKELPRLYLPYSASDKRVLYNPKKIKKHPASDLTWKKRPKSLKRDYRPAKYAGTSKNLELLYYDKELRRKAHIACLTDFATRWISSTSNVKIFRQTRSWIAKQVDKKGKNILFNMKFNKEFIERIGGHKNSFNYRETWPKKVKHIMKQVGLVKLTNDINMKHMSFDEAWSKQ